MKYQHGYQSIGKKDRADDYEVEGINAVRYNQIESENYFSQNKTRRNCSSSDKRKEDGR